MSRHTTSRGNLMALYQALQSYGIDPGPVLEEGDVDLAAVGDDLRIGGEAMDRMVCRAVELTDDPSFGLRFAEYLQPTSFHALGVALLYSPTLRSFGQRVERYFAMATTMDDTRFEEKDGEAWLSTHPLYSYSEVMRRCHPDGWAAWIVKLLRQMCPPGFQPERVDLTWTPPPELQPRYFEYFQCPVEFDAEEARVYLDPSQLDQQLPTANAELARQNDQVVAEFLGRIDRSDFPSRVYAKMIEFLPSGDCDRERVAQALNVTGRTLHNRLESAGTSYQQILDTTRQELAQQYIESGHISISEVAYLLGYADVSSFSRAFRRWTGLSPRGYLKSRPDPV